MANEIFYVKVETSKAATVYAFSRSDTGIMDYAGTASPSAGDLSQMQCVEGSSYFTPSWYTYLPKALQAEITVFIPAAMMQTSTPSCCTWAPCCSPSKNATAFSRPSSCTGVRWCSRTSHPSCCIS